MKENYMWFLMKAIVAKHEQERDGIIAYFETFFSDEELDQIKQSAEHLTSIQEDMDKRLEELDK